MAEVAKLACRVRVQAWTGKLILQVKVRCTDGPDDWRGLPTSLAGEYWRDARVEDLGLLEINDGWKRVE